MKTSFAKTINASQHQVDGHRVDNINPRPSPHVRTLEQVGGSEDLEYNSCQLKLFNHGCRPP
jgi:hypothetical protein